MSKILLELLTLATMTGAASAQEAISLDQRADSRFARLLARWSSPSRTKFLYQGRHCPCGRCRSEISPSPGRM